MKLDKNQKYAIIIGKFFMIVKYSDIKNFVRNPSGLSKFYFKKMISSFFIGTLLFIALFAGIQTLAIHFEVLGSGPHVISLFISGASGGFWFATCAFYFLKGIHFRYKTKAPQNKILLTWRIFYLLFLKNPESNLCTTNATTIPISAPAMTSMG